MKPRLWPLMLAGPLALAACSAAVPEKYTDETLGFQAIADQTESAIGKRTAFARTQAQNEALSEEVRGLVLGKTISADTAVQAALLNNKGLQAAYASAGLSAAEVWQQMTPENPVVSIGILEIGAPELGLYRALESTIAVNLLDAKTRNQRIAVAEMQFQQAQLVAVQETLALAGETRQAWINSVAAFERLSYLRKASETAGAGAELASQLGRTGALNKAGQAREFAFQAELAGQVARARLEASLAKEKLTRLMGLWGNDARYYVPDALPALPRSLSRVASIESAALKNRVDLKVAQIGLEAQARAFGLTDQTRLVTDLELIAGVESDRENDARTIETDTRPQVELEFAIPIFDRGKARLRKAELSYITVSGDVSFAQLEEGSTGTSNINTDGATQTRAAEILATQPSALSTAFDGSMPAALSILIKGTMTRAKEPISYANATPIRWKLFGSDYLDLIISTYGSHTGRPYFRTNVGGSKSEVSGPDTAYPLGAEVGFSLAVVINGDTIEGFFDGVSAGTTTFPGLPDLLTAGLEIFPTSAGATVQELRIWPEALPSAVMLEATS